MKKEDIERLATLSRIRVSEEEKKGFLQDFESILNYVGEIKKVAGEEPSHDLSAQAGAGELRNVMREDAAGPMLASPEELLAEAPERKDGYIKVDQVL